MFINFFTFENRIWFYLLDSTIKYQKYVENKILNFDLFFMYCRFLYGKLRYVETFCFVLKSRIFSKRIISQIMFNLDIKTQFET